MLKPTFLQCTWIFQSSCALLLNHTASLKSLTIDNGAYFSPKPLYGLSNNCTLIFLLLLTIIDFLASDSGSNGKRSKEDSLNACMQTKGMLDVSSPVLLTLASKVGETAFPSTSCICHCNHSAFII